jgi:hypothetical protein
VHIASTIEVHKMWITGGQIYLKVKPKSFINIIE